ALLLRDLVHLTEHLRSRSLIKAGFPVQTEDADGFQHAQGPQRVRLNRVLRLLKRYRHMALRRQIVDFVRLDDLYRADKAAVIGYITVVEEKTASWSVRILDQMVDPSRIKG